MNEWTNAVPKEVGWYWFYGDAHGQARHVGTAYSSVRLESVQVKAISNGLAYIASGAFIYPLGQENAAKFGLWQKMVVPELPKEKE